MMPHCFGLHHTPATWLPLQICILLLLALFPAQLACAADATELLGIGALQLGNAGAGTASAQDASWALMNPAALTSLDKRLDLHLEMVYATFEAEPRGSVLAANPLAGTMKDDVWITIPSGGLVWPTDHGTLALGVYGVQGNRVDYPHSRTTLALPFHADRRMRQDIVKVPLAYSRELDNGWAFGFALVPAIARQKTDSITLRLLPTQGEYEYDWALGLGAVVGLHKKWDRWSIGASYMTRTMMQNFDKYDDLNFWGFDLPEEIRLGLAFRPVPKLELLMDYKWIDWSSINTLGRRSISGGLGINDHHLFKTGITWNVNEQWTLRGGASYGRSPIEDGFVFVNSLTPAVTEWHLACGLSYRWNRRWEFHFAYTHALPRSQGDNGQGDLFSFLARGSTIGFREETLTGQITWRLGA
jgi:long-chain fatty acid transport protein